MYKLQNSLFIFSTPTTSRRRAKKKPNILNKVAKNLLIIFYAIFYRVIIKNIVVYLKKISCNY